MFSYCGNNPVIRIDITGMFWGKIGDFLSKAWNGIKTLVKKTFGAGSSTTVTIKKTETPIIPDPSPVTVKTGTETTKTICEYGDSSKPVSVYANKDALDPVKSSSAGMYINIADYTMDLSFGLDSIGSSGSFSYNSKTYTLGATMNLSELKVEFEGSTSVQWDRMTETTYVNVSVSGWTILAAFLFVTTGQYVQSPSNSYAY